MLKVRHELTAIIYDKRGRTLSVGKNNYVKTHTYQAKCAHEAGLPEKQYLHAEIDAIIKCRDLKKAHKIFISRVMRDGSYGPAKPCPVCSLAIKKAGIRY